MSEPINGLNDPSFGADPKCSNCHGRGFVMVEHDWQGNGYACGDEITDAGGKCSACVSALEIELQRLTERRCEKCQHWMIEPKGDPPYSHSQCHARKGVWERGESCSRFTPKPTEAK